MRRAVVLLVVAFILRSFARAETYTGGDPDPFVEQSAPTVLRPR